MNETPTSSNSLEAAGTTTLLRVIVDTDGPLVAELVESTVIDPAALPISTLV